MNKRRIFIRSMTALAAASVAGIPLGSQAAVQKIDPKDPQAVSLGYTDNTKTVDQAKYPKHDATQACSGCQFYQTAQESGRIAPCTIFGGKGVSANGWCSAYMKKAG
ncbi:MAG: high-potential iron-sulfur protein [Burkholderiaceae bacterium]